MLKIQWKRSINFSQLLSKVSFNYYKELNSAKHSAKVDLDSRKEIGSPITVTSAL